MYRLVLLTVVILGCNGQFSKGGVPIVQQQEIQQVKSVPQLIRNTYAPIQEVIAPGPVDAAIQTRRTIEYRQVALPQDLAQPQIIEVGPNYESVQIHFRTASSPLTVRQSHSPAPIAPVEHTSYQDNAHRLVNEIVKPVIQEVREIIQPYRRITQEIRPVIEEVHTVVHRGDKRAFVAPIALKGAPTAYGTGALLAANKGYRAAKAA